MHTKGSWAVCQIDGGAEDDEIVTEIDGCIINIAAVFGEGHYSMGMPAGIPEPSYYVSRDEAAANARLIAAASDLLAAIQAAMSGVVPEDAWRAMAREAIAKATSAV